MKDMVLLSRNSLDFQEIIFKSPQDYNKIRKILMEQKKGDKDKTLDINFGHDSLLIQSGDVLSLFYPYERLTHSSEQQLFHISIMFEDTPQELVVPVIGTRRANNSFELVKLLFKRDPTDKIIAFNQSENQQALVKHHSRIIKLSKNEVES